MQIIDYVNFDTILATKQFTLYISWLIIKMIQNLSQKYIDVIIHFL